MTVAPPALRVTPGDLGLDVESDIQCRRRMRQSPHRDAFDAGLGDRAHRLNGDAARRLELDLPLLARRVAELDGLAHARAIHIVEQDHVDAVDLQDFAKLFQVIDLDLDQPLWVLAAALRDHTSEKWTQLPKRLLGEV